MFSTVKVARDQHVAGGKTRVPGNEVVLGLKLTSYIQAADDSKRTDSPA